MIFFIVIGEKYKISNRPLSVLLISIGIFPGIGIVFLLSEFESYRIKAIAMTACRENGLTYYDHIGFYQSGKKSPMIQRRYMVYTDEKNYKVILIGSFWMGALSNEYKIE
jgi:hypothetical protein